MSEAITTEKSISNQWPQNIITELNKTVQQPASHQSIHIYGIYVPHNRMSTYKRMTLPIDDLKDKY